MCNKPQVYKTTHYASSCSHFPSCVSTALTYSGSHIHQLLQGSCPLSMSQLTLPQSVRAPPPTLHPLPSPKATSLKCSGLIHYSVTSSVEKPRGQRVGSWCSFISQVQEMRKGWLQSRMRRLPVLGVRSPRTLFSETHPSETGPQNTPQGFYRHPGEP